MSFSNDGASSTQKPETRLVTAGRDTKGQRGFVNRALQDVLMALEGPQCTGRRAVRRYGSTSACRMSTISTPISIAALRC